MKWTIILLILIGFFSFVGVCGEGMDGIIKICIFSCEVKECGDDGCGD